MLNIQAANTFSEYLIKEEKLIEFFQNLRLQNLKEIYIKMCDEFYNFPLMKISESNVKLRKLFMPFCWCRTGIGLENLAQNCRFIQELNINKCGLSNRKLQFLTKFHNLKELQVAGTKIADLTLIEIGKNNKKLEKINLFRCKRITKIGVEGLLKETKNLQKINIIGTKLNFPKRIAIYKMMANIGEISHRCDFSKM